MGTPQINGDPTELLGHPPSPESPDMTGELPKIMRALPANDCDTLKII